MAIQLQCEKIVDGMGWLVWDLLAQEPNLTMLRQTYGESTEYGGWMGWDWITKGNSETYNVAVSKMPCSRARAKRSIEKTRNETGTRVLGRVEKNKYFFRNALGRKSYLL
ncbi:hypothetical protein AVEN_103107-1 [Araneus ventricosus]|uniref:Uncharacterized protein n=1 Tax=Araneus ventricosus TaxID=182803 RepID=A0A4Y2RJB6_ARAVE|nr:hypothetical protein AVEN_103107-1 [Araneus ventricosus]